MNCETCGKRLSKSKYTHCKKHAGGRFLGRKHTAESRAKTSASIKSLNRSANEAWIVAVRIAGLKRRKRSRKCVDCCTTIDRHSTYCKSCARMGKRNPSYFDGNYWERMTLRTTREYRQWNMSVRKRDNHTCQLCRTTEGRLEVDHIKPFALFPELRLEISNGRVLCHECHKAQPTFGGKLKRTNASVMTL